jgi:hypothetical protein
VNTRFGRVMGIFKTVQFVETNDLTQLYLFYFFQNNRLRRYTKIPFLWIMPFSENNLEIPLIGRRGFYPSNFVSIGPQPTFSLHPLYYDLMKDNHSIIHIKFINDVSFEGYFKIDTCSPKSILHPSVGNSKELTNQLQLHFEQNEKKYIEFGTKLKTSGTIHGILGFDFLCKYSVILYQGHLLQKENQNEIPFQFLERSLPLRYRIHEKYIPNYSNEVLDDYYFKTKTPPFVENQIEVSISKNGGDASIWCSFKSTKMNFLYANQSQLQKLNLSENTENIIQLKLDKLVIHSIPVFVIKSRFPLLIVSHKLLNNSILKEYHSLPYLKILSSVGEIFKIPFDVSIGYLYQDGVITIPYDRKQTKIQISTLFSTILNVEKECYISLKKVKFLNAETEDRLFQTLKIIEKESNSFTVEFVYK